MTDSFKEKFRQAVAETGAVVYSYLPEDELQREGGRKAFETAADAGSIPFIRRERTGDRAVHGGDGDDPHVLTDPR